MADRLLVVVLGNRKSGKSTTWNQLFDVGTSVRTGLYERDLYLNKIQHVKAFLISGSPEEREVKVKDLLPETLPSIVLCSAQYHEDVKDTFNHFFKNGYEVFVQWLNPGHGDAKVYADHLGLKDYLLDKGATLQIRDGSIDARSRVKELRQFILGWAGHRDLIRTEWPA